MRTIQSLSPAEILSLAISLEEEDAKIYDSFAASLHNDYPTTARIFEKMRDDEAGHRHRLLDLYRQKFGLNLILVRRGDIRGFIHRRPIWLNHPLRIAAVRHFAAVMETETVRFYESAARQTADVDVRQLLGDLADVERGHAATAEHLAEDNVSDTDRQVEEETQRRLFLLQIVQPGLAGLMDGSVSTLAPLFAAALATRLSHDALLVGLAASLGAGISMGFAEALSDDGALTGRGHPWVRGIICGLMTTLGGLGHTLPFLLSSFNAAMIVAIIVVVIELAVISFIRHRYMDTPFLSAAFQVIVGGTLVFLTGILIGARG